MHGRGCAWQEGGMHDRGACMARETATVRILLECILVQFEFVPVILDHSVL